jgi:thiosulfate/3-mercaptopyruvate sulfurtransferase
LARIAREECVVTEGPFGPVVSTAWLAERLGAPDLRVLDATWYMPHLQRNARAEFEAAHIPGAAYFDIDAIADPSQGLPHMLPDAKTFGQAVGALGIGNGDRVVVYGGKHLIASARVWWTFRVFGHDRVAVLDGGFPRWRDEGRPVEVGAARPARRDFTARLHPELVTALEGVRHNLVTRRAQIVDARSSGRFVGSEPEPRPGLRGGHIPGSLNLPYDRLFEPDGALLPQDRLRQAFDAARVDLEQPIATTCGSGVSACVLALGLHVIGRPDVAVYDGSWSEWGERHDVPVER